MCYVLVHFFMYVHGTVFHILFFGRLQVMKVTLKLMTNLMMNVWWPWRWWGTWRIKYEVPGNIVLLIRFYGLLLNVSSVGTSIGYTIYHISYINGVWVQERNPDILFFSLKSPGKRTPSRFPNRAPMEREAHLQDILHISQKPHLSGSPVKEPSLKFPFMESLAGDAPPLEPPSPTYQDPLGWKGAPMETDARIRRLS